jgi:hypothetical protein
MRQCERWGCAAMTVLFVSLPIIVMAGAKHGLKLDA